MAPIKLHIAEVRGVAVVQELLQSWDQLPAASTDREEWVLDPMANENLRCTNLGKGQNWALVPSFAK